MNFSKFDFSIVKGLYLMMFLGKKEWLTIELNRKIFIHDISSPKCCGLDCRRSWMVSPAPPPPPQSPPFIISFSSSSTSTTSSSDSPLLLLFPAHWHHCWHLGLCSWSFHCLLFRLTPGHEAGKVQETKMTVRDVRTILEDHDCDDIDNHGDDSSQNS